MIHKQIYFYVDTIQNINFDYIKKIKAILIIKSGLEPNLEKYKKIAENCRKRNISLFISNDQKLMFKLGLKNFTYHHITKSIIKIYQAV